MTALQDQWRPFVLQGGHCSFLSFVQVDEEDVSEGETEDDGEEESFADATGPELSRLLGWYWRWHFKVNIFSATAINSYLSFVNCKSVRRIT